MKSKLYAAIYYVMTLYYVKIRSLALRSKIPSIYVRPPRLFYANTNDTLVLQPHSLEFIFLLCIR
jgi:hypothetical protein